MTPLRILFYCHNTLGLGHVVRSLRIIKSALGEGMRCAIVTGCRFLDDAGVPDGVDVCQLAPAVLDGAGRPVGLDGADDVLVRRGAQIVRFCGDWKPDAIVVDHHPLGLGGELVDTLLASTAAHMFLGVPYTQGAPAAPFRNPRLRAAAARYRDVLDYSDEGVLPLCSVRPERVVRVGIVTRAPLPPREPGLPPRIVVLAGGGTRGADLQRLVISALHDFPEWRVRLLVGPFGDAAETLGIVNGRAAVEVIASGKVEEAIRDATVIVSRAGYNSSYAIVQTDLPVIFVPTQFAGDDQPSRARRLSTLPKVWNIDERDPAAASHIERILRGDLTRAPRPLPFDTNGAANSTRVIVARVRGASPRN
jgi:predicted glycosyltransferase